MATYEELKAANKADAEALKAENLAEAEALKVSNKEDAEALKTAAEEEKPAVENVETEETVGETETEERVPEPWELTPEDQGKTSEKVPLKTLLKSKEKNKLKLADKDSEIESLKEQVAALKTTPVKNDSAVLKRPVEYDFESDEEYYKALDEYDDKRFEARENARIQREQGAKIQNQNQKAVDAHWERAEKLVEEANIKPDHYKDADQRVRSAMEVVAPQRGDLITEQIISIIGEGSEKVLFFLGRNDDELAIVQSKFAEDPSGLKVAAYLGGLNNSLSKPAKKTTNAPKPAPNLNGGSGGVSQETAAIKDLKKKYDSIHDSGGSVQDAYNIKKQARGAGVDTSSW